jgi:repressor LexA
VPSRQSRESRGVPILGRVAAGAPILADENVEDVLELPAAWVADDVFLLRVQGDSMRDAHIVNGDLVAVRPRKTAADGEIVVALIEDEATVKRFRKTGGGVELAAENPDYPPILLSKADGKRMEILGVVVGVFRPSLAAGMSRRNS